MIETTTEFVIGLIIILFVVVIIIFLIMTPFGGQIAASFSKIGSSLSNLFAPVTTS